MNNKFIQQGYNLAKSANWTGLKKALSEAGLSSALLSYNELLNASKADVSPDTTTNALIRGALKGLGGYGGYRLGGHLLRKSMQIPNTGTLMGNLKAGAKSNLMNTILGLASPFMGILAGDTVSKFIGTPHWRQEDIGQMQRKEMISSMMQNNEKLNSLIEQLKKGQE